MTASRLKRVRPIPCRRKKVPINLRPPKALRDAHYAGAKKLGHGTGYIYPHDDPTGFEVDYLPDELKGRKYYKPSHADDDRAQR